jgi:hypothetical protein
MTYGNTNSIQITPDKSQGKIHKASTSFLFLYTDKVELIVVR